MQAYLKDAPGATPEEAARTLVWMATSPECGVDGGRYFYELEEKQAAACATNDESARRLWDETEKILEATASARSPPRCCRHGLKPPGPLDRARPCGLLAIAAEGHDPHRHDDT